MMLLGVTAKSLHAGHNGQVKLQDAWDYQSFPQSLKASTGLLTHGNAGYDGAAVPLRRGIFSGIGSQSMQRKPLETGALLSPFY